MRPIIALIKKEFQQILRDRVMLIIIFLAPLVQTILMGYAVTTDVKHQRLVILDQDGSVASRQLIASLRNCGYFDIEGLAASRGEVRNWIERSEADLAVVFPPNFGAELRTNMSPTVQILVDGQNSNTSFIGTGYITGVLQEFSRSLVIDRVVATPDNRKEPLGVLEARIRVFYNPTLESVYYMIPGVVTVLLTVVTMMLSAMGLVREKETGTLEQLLVTPIRSYQLLIGKLVPFAVLGFFALSLVLSVGSLWFKLPFLGNAAVVALGTVIFLLSTLGMGLFISTLASTQQQAMFIAWFFMVFGLLMSGFFYAIENMPLWAQRITLINPLRYYLTILREVFLKGAGLQHLKLEFLALAAMGVSVLTLTVLRFRAKLK